MDDMCTDNRFELIERFKKKLIESTNIETSPEEMKAIDNLLFRFWQMGWLDIIDRMLLVKESAKTLMHSVGNSVSAKAFRNAGRFIQNAIDGEAPEFEKIPSAQPERTCVNCGRTVNNGGWYADGRTRCPIEEHYALPKDGYCHLWEKRGVTDDDYPERREE